MSVLDDTVESPFESADGLRFEGANEPGADPSRSNTFATLTAPIRSLDAALEKQTLPTHSSIHNQSDRMNLQVHDVTYIDQEETVQAERKPPATPASVSLSQTERATPLKQDEAQQSKQNNDQEESVVVEDQELNCPSVNEVWSKLAQTVNRTFKRVNRKIMQNSNWLTSSECDLNELEKNILCAFNIDIRKTAIESQDITLEHNGIKYGCKHGIFLQEVKRLKPDKHSGTNPCFGEYSLTTNKEKQVSIKCVSDQCHFMVLNRKSFSDVLAGMAQKRLSHIIKFVETIPCFSNQTRTNMEYFCKHMQKVYFQRNQIVYREGEKVSNLYIVKKGQFELKRPIKTNFSKNTSKILGLLGMDDI